MRGILGPGFGTDLFQPVRDGRNEAKAKVIASGLQLTVAFRLALFLAALRHRDVDHFHFGFAEQPHGQAAGNAFIVRVRREEKRFGRAGRNCGMRSGRKPAQRQRLGLVHGL